MLIWQRSRAGALVVVVAAVAIVLVLLRLTAQPSSGGVATSTAKESWSLPRLSASGVIALHEFSGRPLVVDFFASWCTACQDELPIMASAARQLTGRVDFVGVDSLETGDGVAMARKYGIDKWPLARDVDGSADSGLHDALGGVGMPITAFYDSDGKLLYVAPGAMTAQTFEERLHTLFGQTVSL